MQAPALRLLYSLQAPPSLPQDKIFSQSFRTFVSRCLERSPQQRSTVTDLMDHPFVAEISDEDAQAVCKEWFPQVHRVLRSFQWPVYRARAHKYAGTLLPCCMR